MMIQFLFLMMALQPQQPLEQELRRQQQQVEQMRQQLQQLDGTVAEMQKQSSQDRQQQPRMAVCSAELRWVTSGQDVRVPSNPAAVVPLNLFSTVSQPSSACLAADVLLTASYIDASDRLVCTGTVQNVASQISLAQSINLDIRPWNLQQFVHWRNEPPEINSGARRLACINPEGQAEATPEELGRVAAVKVRTTVLPASGGMSTAEIKLTLR